MVQVQKLVFLKVNFLKKILDKWNYKKYYLLDLWSNQNTINNEYDEKWAKDNKKHNDNYNKTIDNVKEHLSKIQIIKNYSNLAVNNFKNEYFDFIYIDANHSYDSVKNDLKFGVKKAVDEFCFDNNYNISLDYYGDWYYKHNNFLIPSRNWYFIKH